MTSISVFMARYFSFMAMLMAGVIIHIIRKLIGIELSLEEKKITAVVMAAGVGFVAGFVWMAWRFYTL